ncbi:zinc finger, CCHC-type containing protein [Tanacetum coccineum]
MRVQFIPVKGMEEVSYGGDNPTMEQVRKRAKQDNDDYVCRGLILNGHPHIEESLRVQNSDKPKSNNVAGPSVVNMVEHNKSSRGVVRLPDLKLKTLGERGIKCIFVGYAEHSKDFRFYVIEPNDSVLINLIIESRDTIFDENRFSSVLRPNLRIPNRTKDIGGSVVPKEVTEEVVQQPEPDLRKSKRNRTSKNFGPEFQTYLIEGTRDEVHGTIEKFKARLVIQGFRQKSRIDYFDTYALVALISTIRLLIAMTSIYNLIIHQMDGKTTFLNDELEEEQAPNKFDESGKGVIICLYVDDMLIFGTDQVQVDLTKEFLSSRFSMKDMGEADVILGEPLNLGLARYWNKLASISSVGIDPMTSLITLNTLKSVGTLSERVNNLLRDEEKDIEDMTIAEYMEYEAEMKRQSWRDAQSYFPIEYDDGDVGSFYLEKSRTLDYPYYTDDANIDTYFDLPPLLPYEESVMSEQDTSDNTNTPDTPKPHDEGMSSNDDVEECKAVYKGRQMKTSKTNAVQEVSSMTSNDTVKEDDRPLRLVPSCFAIFTFEPLTLSLMSMPSCDLVSLTTILIPCLILKASNQS